MNVIEQFLKKEYKLYCDMDGVLCDFNGAVIKLGAGSPEDIVDKYGNDTLMWSMISKKGISFWSEMEWMPDGKDLWQYIKKFKPVILSTPMRTNPASEKGKELWVKNHLGFNVKLQLSFDKEKYATPESILIDDREKNIKEWKAAGGIGILHRHTKITLSKLKSIMGV